MASRLHAVAVIVVGAWVSGCGGSSNPAPEGSSSGAVKAQAGTIAGRVLGQDGAPISVAEDVAISVYGVSEAGERVQYSPAVKADGIYRQKIVPGSFRVGRSLVKIRSGQELFSFELTPQGNLWNKDREAAEGIVQDFVWNMTGQRTTDLPNPNNHTHWYGMSIGVGFSMWREDLKKGTQPPPDGSTIVFTLTPLSKLINGQDGKELVIERAWRAQEVTPIDDLNDLPPASYRITAVARLPGGQTRPLLLQGPGDYPHFKPETKAVLANDGIIGGLAKWRVGFVLPD